MTDVPFAPDEIGPWSEIKFEIIEKYGPAYTQAFSGKGRNLKKFYIDGFSGAGLHVSKATRATVEGSPARALRVSPEAPASEPIEHHRASRNMYDFCFSKTEGVLPFSYRRSNFGGGPRAEKIWKPTIWFGSIGTP